MRGVNLNVFQFDYDLTWVGFVLDADERVYARYGQREGANADEQLSLAGLKYALQKARDAFRRGDKPPPPPAVAPHAPEQYAASRRLKADACIHCHQVYDFQRDDLRVAGKWTKEAVWVYPPPHNVGLTLDVDRGDRVKAVAAGSPAARAGLRPGDVLRRLNGRPVASIADAKFALNLAPPQGSIPVTWERGGQGQSGTLELPAGWKESDISWRTSMWNLAPTPGVHGPNLTPEEKQKFGLAPERLAFRQGKYVTNLAKRAGIREGDVILGIDGKELAMTMLQFNAYVRLNYQVGDTITLEVLRDGRRLKVPLTLAAKAN
jgi:hypothetical protein